MLEQKELGIAHSPVVNKNSSPSHTCEGLRAPLTPLEKKARDEIVKPSLLILNTTPGEGSSGCRDVGQVPTLGGKRKPE